MARKGEIIKEKQKSARRFLRETEDTAGVFCPDAPHGPEPLMEGPADVQDA